MIDSNIALGYRPVQIEPQSNALARALGIQSAMNQNQAQQLAMEDAQYARDRRNKLESILSSGGGEQELLRGGFVNESTALAKQRRENEKLQNEADVKKFELFKNKFDMGIQQLGGVNDAAGAKAWLTQQVKDGLMPMQAAQAEMHKLQSNPAAFGAWKDGLLRTGMTASQQMENALRQRTEARNAANDVVVIGPDGRPQVNQIAVQAKSAVAQAGAPITYGTPVAVTLPNGQQGLVQPGNRPGAPPQVMTLPGGGNLKPGAASAAPNEGQANAALYASRMVEADKILTGTNADPVKVAGLQVAQNVPLIGALTGGAANAASAPETQMVDQAQRNFINAALRRESGAAISPTEFDNARKQYFPQPGDSPQVIAQKAANRRTAIQGINNAAGPAKVDTSGGLPAGWSITPVAQ